jgi:2-polyprenyl-3-methyl-5-hydroxy-6-metoxy-1,4-benzoquinol methylase
MTTQFNYEKHSYGYSVLTKNDLTSGATIHFLGVLDFLKKIPESATILDIGCGAGAILRSLQPYYPNLRLFGTDISEIAITEARAHSTNINYEQSTAEKLPYSDNTFDAVLMFEVLEHVENPEQSLCEIYRILKPEGKLYLAVPQEKSLLTIQGILYFLFKINLTEKTAGHIQFWNKSELDTLLKNAGFIEEQHTYGQHVTWQIVAVFYLLILIATNTQTQELTKKAADRNKLSASIIHGLIRAIIGITNIESLIARNLPYGIDIQYSLKIRKSSLPNSPSPVS